MQKLIIHKRLLQQQCQRFSNTKLLVWSKVWLADKINAIKMTHVQL